MANKKLLEESTIRRFMELANIKPTESRMLSEGQGQRMPFPVRKDRAGKEDDTRMVREEEEKVEEASEYEEGMDLEEAEGEGEEEAPEMAGDEMGAGMEGGDLESAVEQLVSAMNGVLSAAGMSDKTVELDSGEGEEAGMEDMGGEGEGEEEAPEAGGDELAESVQLVDDSMINRLVQRVSDRLMSESVEVEDNDMVETLLQRVSARLVAEARRSRELAEGKSGWGKHGMHASAAKSKSSTKGKGAGKKQGAPFNKPVSGVKGLAGRGR